MESYFSDLLSKDKDFRVEYVKNKLSDNQPIHQFHDYFELFYQLSGDRHFFVRNKIYNLHRGDIALIDERDLHKMTSSHTPTYSRILIHFRKRSLQGMLSTVSDINLDPLLSGEYSVISLNLNQQEYVEHLLFDILRESQECREGYATKIKLLLVQLFISLSRDIQQNAGEPVMTYSHTQKQVMTAAQYIGMHFTENLTLEGLARQFSLSRYYFCRAFREITGFTIVEYINSVRVRRAQELLRETDASILKIAMAVGFQSNSHFGRVFKDMVKCSPSEYRKGY